ncbi:MAG TPA: protein tyrosine phosphatase family protein [Steroidobacter sp.]|uniref:protein tyrosine phosphatase family protein n=1 Tax=Steroidobacter sp. TaxID=1978227 RepID=UPI002EDA1786
MKTTIFLSLILCFGLTQAAPAADDALIGELPNMRQPADNRIVSGAIDASDIGRIRAAGIKHLINLRPPEESQDLDEARIATGLGLDYHAIPIAGAQSLTKENARRLDELLEQAGDEPTLVHCASGNRVGALIAVREAWIKGQSMEAAIAEGKRWGLTSLEGEVRAALNDASK